MSVLSFLRVFLWFKPYLEVCRVESWLSWVFGFGLGSVLFGPPSLFHAVSIFFAFSLATASVFVLNQYFDLEVDKRNKLKSNLPVASGQISSRHALVFSLLLVSSCFALVFMVDAYVWPSFLLYLVLWTSYSSSFPRLKTIPVVDFIASGVGAGFFPFFIGSGVPEQPGIGTSVIMLTTIPLTLFHCGAHIIQTIGDYEADRETEVNTFVVKYGVKKGVTTAGLMFLSASLSTFTYLFAGLVSLHHLTLFFIIIPFFVHPLLCFKNLYENPCSSSVMSLQKSVRKYGILALLITWVYVLMAKFVFTGL